MISYRELIANVGERRYRIVANTQDEWFSFDKLDAQAESGVRKEYLFEVELSPDPNNESSDVLNLQYFFVRTERALRIKREKGEDAIFILLVKVKSLDDMYRVSAYLYLQGILRSDMRFYIQFDKHTSLYEPTPDPRGLGHIPPLLYVTRFAGGNGLSYRQLAETGQNSEAQMSEKQIDFCCDYAKGRALEDSKNKQVKQQEGPPVNEVDTLDSPGESDNEADAPQKSYIDSNKNGETTLQKITKDKLFIKSKYQAICANYLIEALCKIKGPRGRPLSAEMKCELIGFVCDCIKERRDTITPLGQLIWFIYLCYLQDTKEIVEWSSEDMEAKNFSIRTDRLDKSYIDSIEYANGILQLLENSCQHTQAEAGYLSMRIHYVDRACAESRLEDVASSRSRLIKRYSKGYTKTGKTYPFFPRRLVLEDDISYYFELRVIDDASFQESDEDSLRSRGISVMHKRNRKISDSENVELFQVFDRLSDKQKRADVMCDDETLDSITYHYGVKLLQKIVLRNQGYLLVSSPAMQSKHIEIYSSYLEAKLPDSMKDSEGKLIDLSNGAKLRRSVGWQQITCPGQNRATEYQIILPLSYRWHKSAEKPVRNLRPPNVPLDLSILQDSRQCKPGTIHMLNKFDIFSNNLHYFGVNDQPEYAQARKIEIVIKLQEILTEIFEKEKEENVDIIHVLDFSGLSGTKLEWVAKALFRYIGKERMAHPEQVEKHPLLFAMYFNNIQWVQNFTLEYSAFYDTYGRNPFMNNVQIAVCCLNEEWNIPEVCFLLAGTNIASAKDTAEMFLYYNSGSARNLLPQLQYLTDTLGRAEDSHGAIAPFPFDLYLREIPDPVTGEWKSTLEADKKGISGKGKPIVQENRVLTAPADDCWFLQHMVCLIENEMQMRGQGCKIPQIHVRLGSKMHIEDFYEAELLFQNIGVVSRLAFLIVHALLFKTPIISKSLLVVGYENYSTILLEYIVQFLDECGLEAVYGLYGFNSAGKGEFFPSAALSRKGKPLEKECQLVTVYPIGTTLSTVYQMIDSVSDIYKLNPYMNFCVLIVTDEEKNSHLQESYWSRRKERHGQLAESAEEHSTLTMQPDKVSRPRTEVRYFLEAKTRWHDSRQCVDGKPDQEDVLTYVDRTSTVPNMIFPLSGRKNDGASSFLKGKGNARNNERLEQLRGCVLYGHTYSGNNHFLYNLDLSKYFGIIDESSKSDLERWLSGLNSKIDAEAYNVIVAPMERDNSSFLHAIVNKVFAHSIRVLRIPFLEVRKEDIRAKFSFIADEYKKIKTANPDMQINIYYVATSIVTGETFYRAAKLIGMLLEESNCYVKNDAFLFKGIFLLVNRSSRSTIQTMVQDPDKEFHAYLHLAVPHYNTYRGICPACLRKERSAMVLQNCTTNLSAQNFNHMEKKQELRTAKEYLSWQRHNLFESPRAFSMLCLWLYRFRTQYPDSLDKDKIERLRTLLLEKRNGEIMPLCLNDFRCDIKDILPQEELEQLWLNYVLQDKAFLRLSCTHKAYCALEDDRIINCEPKEAEQKAAAFIFELFQKEFDKKLPPEEYIERIISYTKVLSREYLAKYHYIRQAIFRVLTNMLRFMLGEPQKTSEQAAQIKVLKRCREALPLQQYQLIITILKQLSGMQANLVMRDDILQDFAQCVDRLRQEQMSRYRKEPLALLCPLPTAAEIELDYETCVKWGMLSGDEENKCFLLQQEQSIWKKGSDI